MQKIVICEFMDAGAVDSLRDRFDLRFDDTLVDRPAELLDLLGDADALLVRNRTQVNAALLARAPKLRVVGRLGVGLDNIEMPACEKRGITVIPATGANAPTVAEYVVCTVMMLLRGAYHSSAEVAAGRWPRTALAEGRETAGKTLGIVGFGGIGRLTARLAQGLGMRVVACDAAIPADAPVWRETNVARRELDALLAESDAVTLHIPLTPETRGLIDARRLALLPPGAVLVNTSRGGTVDEAALAAALREGRLGGAALDVFEQEPLKAGSPLVDVPRLILTPHIAGLTRESSVRVSTLIAEKVAAALQ
jgi:(S)-sulfolactate dehydrogenase